MPPCARLCLGVPCRARITTHDFATFGAGLERPAVSKEALLLHFPTLAPPAPSRLRDPVPRGGACPPFAPRLSLCCEQPSNLGNHAMARGHRGCWPLGSDPRAPVSLPGGLRSLLSALCGPRCPRLSPAGCCLLSCGPFASSGSPRRLPAAQRGASSFQDFACGGLCVRTVPPSLEVGVRARVLRCQCHPDWATICVSFAI